MAERTKLPEPDCDRRAPGDERLQAVVGLSATASHRQRVMALTTLGLSVDELAHAFRVAPSTVRNWHDGSVTPRQKATRILDDLRAAALVLLESGLPPEEAGQWIRSRNLYELANERPLDAIKTDPLRVLAAAEAVGLRRAMGRGDDPHLELVGTMPAD